MALSDFYRAFNTQNIQLMELSWLNSETISMSNPIGGIRKGWNEIKAGYERIFTVQQKYLLSFTTLAFTQVKIYFLLPAGKEGVSKMEKLKLH